MRLMYPKEIFREPLLSPEKQQFVQLLACAKYIITVGRVGPGTEQWDRAFQTYAYYTMCSVYDWCASYQIPLQLPLSLNETYAIDPYKPLLSCGSSLLAEMMRRNRGNDGSYQNFLRLLDKEAGSLKTDYKVGKLKHLCTAAVRKHVWKCCEKRADLNESLNILPAPRFLRRTVMMKDLEVQIGREMAFHGLECV